MPTPDQGPDLPPGWYPDPDDPSVRRYFDGQSWSAPLQNDPTTPRASSKWPLLATAAVALVAVALSLVVWAPWSSDDTKSPPAAVRITDPRVAKSDSGSAFIVDLYGAEHASFWRSEDQDRLFDIGGIECIQRRSAPTDLASDFKGLSPDAINEFIALMDKDLCGVMERTGGYLP